MLTVGLTGNVAAGKSAVADHFARWGATVIDADRIVHGLQAPGTEVFRRIRGRFGSEVVRPDGTLDRGRLRRLVMGDRAMRDALNRIVHPAVQRERERLERAAREAGDCVVVHVIPLLFEVLDPASFDAVVLVDAPPDARRRRLTAHRHLSSDEADRLIAAQMPSDTKRERADVVIDNIGTLDELEAAARTTWVDLRRRAARRLTAGGTVLAVFAHPDDESFAAGGTIARYADAGVAVHLVCATRGEAGTQHAGAPPSRLARDRAGDVRRAAEILGVRTVRLLGLADGALDPDDPGGAAAVADALAELRPDAVVTFGADGVTGHPDHRAVHRWTTRAWEAGGRHGRLFFVCYPEAVATTFATAIHGLPEARVAARLDVRPWADVKRAAIRAHRSQRPPFDLDAEAVRPIFEREWYAGPTRNGARLDDLIPRRNALDRV